MARIIIPDDFAGQQTLWTAILAQHKVLGSKSPLTVFAKQQKMDLAKLEAAIELAAAQDNNSKALKRESENETQLRDNELSVPWANLLGEVQYLKNFFAGNERELGDWGITVDGAHNRIVYPAGTAAQVKLIQTFLAKHNSYDPGESPLQWYIDEHEIDVAADLKAAGDALTDEGDRNRLTGDSELATQTRDTIWAPVVTAIHLIGAFLMGLYKEDSRKMAAWGFAVVEDAAGEREQHSKVNPLETKNQKSVVIPSVLTNVGEVDLQVIQGKGENSKVYPLKPGEQLGMVRGFSKVTVINPSTLVVGKVQVIVNK